jgi:hypothetical protein
MDTIPRLVVGVPVISRDCCMFNELEFVSCERYENPEEKLVRDSDFVTGSRNR